MGPRVWSDTVWSPAPSRQTRLSSWERNIVYLYCIFCVVLSISGTHSTRSQVVYLSIYDVGVNNHCYLVILQHPLKLVRPDKNHQVKELFKLWRNCARQSPSYQLLLNMLALQWEKNFNKYVSKEEDQTDVRVIKILWYVSLTEILVKYLLLKNIEVWIERITGLY